MNEDKLLSLNSIYQKVFTEHLKDSDSDDLVKYLDSILMNGEKEQTENVIADCVYRSYLTMLEMKSSLVK